MSHLNYLLLFGGCLAVSFLMSGMEAGVLAVNRLRLRRLVRAGDTRATLLQGYLDQPENFLWTTLVGNTVANCAIFALLAAALDHYASHAHGVQVAVFLGAAFLFYTWFDLLPKMLFQASPNRVCLAFVRPFRIIHLVLIPIVVPVSWFARLLLHWTGGKQFTGRLFGNRDELRVVMQETGRALNSEEKAMINRVLDLQAQTVGQITTPMSRTVRVRLTTTLGEALQIARQQDCTRLPVLSGEKGHVVGILNLKAILYQDRLDESQPVDEHLKPALYLDENVRLEAALERMQRSGRPLAIVTTRDEKTEIGVVSIEDILKVIFGEVNL